MEENKTPAEENKTPPEPVNLTEAATIPSTNPPPAQTIVSENKTPETPISMEVHHHELHHKPKPWKEYFFEFIMIVLAVTTGFLPITCGKI